MKLTGEEAEAEERSDTANKWHKQDTNLDVHPCPASAFKKKVIYLAVLGLSCSTWNLASSLWEAESLVAACGIFSRGMRDLSP